MLPISALFLIYFSSAEYKTLREPRMNPARALLNALNPADLAHGLLRAIRLLGGRVPAASGYGRQDSVYSNDGNGNGSVGGRFAPGPAFETQAPRGVPDAYYGNNRRAEV